MKQTLTIYGIMCLAVLSCTPSKEAQTTNESYPDIFPDYTFTSVPCNIAPLNFGVEGATTIRADFTQNTNLLLSVVGKEVIDIPETDWKKILTAQKGNTLSVTVSVWNEKHPEGIKYKPFTVEIAPDSIDGWIAYRLIESGYEAWNQMGIYQRDLSSFAEKEIVSNREDKSTCVNCHSFNQYSHRDFMFHARGQRGGTIIVQDGIPEKVALDKLGSGKQGAYPAWHPSGRYIAFSSNVTRQSFLHQGEKPLEVYDLESELILYDTKQKQVLADPRFNGKEQWETFPGWSPDGTQLYFCSASPKNMPLDYKEVRYALCRVSFDAASGKLGEQVDTLYSPEVKGGSVSFPRISPDGKYLLYTEAASATFPIWHKEADLKMINIENRETVNTDIINSEDTESYHAWSSDGRWILFSSRRIDGRYTRLYMAWMDASGTLHKPFLLPQRNPGDNLSRMKSYNIPEFIREEVTLPQQKLSALF